jgi:TusA-related sulfurtransferase
MLLVSNVLSQFYIVREGLNSISDNQTLKIKTTDKSALKDFKSFCDKTGHQLVEHFKENEVTIFYIKKLTL